MEFKNGQAKQYYYDAFNLMERLEEKLALEVINDSLALEEHPDSYLRRGQIYFGLQETENAISDFGKAIELNVNEGRIFPFKGI